MFLLEKEANQEHYHIEMILFEMDVHEDQSSKATFWSSYSDESNVSCNKWKVVYCHLPSSIY